MKHPDECENIIDIREEIDALDHQIIAVSLQIKTDKFFN